MAQSSTYLVGHPSAREEIQAEQDTDSVVSTLEKSDAQGDHLMMHFHVSSALPCKSAFHGHFRRADKSRLMVLARTGSHMFT